MQRLENPATELTLKDGVQILRRRKWAIIETWGLVIMAGTVATMTATSIFRAEAKLLVRATPSYAYVNTLDSQNPLVDLLALAQPESVETQMQVLQSDPFLERVYRRAGLTSAAAPSIQATHIPDTNVISITVESADAKLAQRMANTTVGEYLDYTRETGLAEIKSARRFVEQERARAQRALEKAEHALLAFRQGSQVSQLTAERDSRLKELVDLDTRCRDNANAITRATGQLEKVKAQLEREPATRPVPASRRDPSREALEGRLAELKTQREELLADYRSDAPQVASLTTRIERIEKLLETQPRENVAALTTANPAWEGLRIRSMELDRDLRGFQKERVQLAAQLREKQARMGLLGPMEVRLGQLVRAQEAAQKSFQMLDERLEDLTIRENARHSDARIVESATLPAAPVRPRKSVNLILAAAMGLVLGLAVAFLQENMDDRLTTAEEVDRALGLPVLGHVPVIPGRQSPLLTSLPGHSPVAESYRALRSAIRFAGVEHPLRTLVVSSADKGEGKSVTATNLAIAMALEGRRVILVDTDLRHPTVHGLLGWEMKPGLTELLVDAVPLEQALREHPRVSGLQVIPSGAMPPNPAELINSAPMEALIARLTALADVVIFDCPPCLPVTDAVLLSAKVDGVLLVADIGRARRAGLKYTREQLERARARLVGLIFNKVGANEGGGYPTYYYHRGYYGDDRPEMPAAPMNGHRNGKASAANPLALTSVTRHEEPHEDA